MNANTDDILAHIKPDATSLLIREDKTLGPGDIKLICDKIRDLPNLTALHIIDCGLTDDSIGHFTVPGSGLAFVIAHHPNLRHIDLSDNNFKSLSFIAHIINNKTMSIDVTGNSYGDMTDYITKPDYEAIIRAAAASNIVQLSLPDHYPKKYYWFFDPVQSMSSSKNLVEYNISENSQDYKSDQASAEMEKICQDNREAAARIIERVQNAQTISADDISNFNARILAVAYLLEKNFDYKKAMTIMRKFHDKAMEQLHVETDLYTYFPQPEEIAPRTKTAAAPAPVAIEPTTITPIDLSTGLENILANLPKFDTGSLESQIKAARNNPSELRNLGHSVIETATTLVNPALKIMNADPTLHTPTALFDAFLDEFDQARTMLGTITGKTLPVSMAQSKRELFSHAPQPKPQPETRGVFASLFSSPHTTTLTDVADTADAANQILGEMVAKTQSVQQAVALQMQTTDKVTETYRTLTEQLETVISTARKVLKDWEQETGKTFEAGEVKPFHIQTLSTRITHLDDALTNIRVSHSGYVIHGGMIQQEMQNFDTLVNQHLGFLTAAVETFALHTRNVHDASTTSKASERDLDVLAVIRALENVDQLAAGAREALDVIGTSAIEIRGHVPQLMPTKTITQAVVSAVRPLAPPPAAAPTTPNV